MTDTNLILVRGGGDIATGSIQKLMHAGYPLIVLEAERPSAIRRYVALSEAVYEGEWQVEDMTGVRIDNFSDADKVIASGKIPVLADPHLRILGEIRPFALIDAILAKRNMGTTRDMAGITVGLGPGFTAGLDVDAVVETMRGHDLGRLLFQGSALPDTGVPGLIEGYGKERVVHAPAAGLFESVRKIGDTVEKGEIIAKLGDVPVTAGIGGVIRGMIRDGYPAAKGLKIADIDPRLSQAANCYTISDKARCIGGSVLEAVLMLRNLGMVNAPDSTRGL
jgi:xanthine dehydrogenase accessory factor